MERGSLVEIEIGCIIDNMDSDLHGLGMSWTETCIGPSLLWTPI